MLSVELGRDANSGAWRAHATHVGQTVTGGGTDLLHEEQPSRLHRNPRDAGLKGSWALGCGGVGHACTHFSPSWDARVLVFSEQDQKTPVVRLV